MNRHLLSASGRPTKRFTGLAVLLAVFVGSVPILADRDEIILTISIRESTSAHSVDGGLRISSPSGGTQFALSGQRITVPEGEQITLEVVPDVAYEFSRWDGVLRGNGRIVTTAFYADLMIRAVVDIKSDSDEDEDSDEDTTGSVGVGTPSPPSTGEGEQAQAQSAATRASRAITEIWVDFHHLGIESGTVPNPFNTTAEGVAAVDATTATILNFQPGVSQETPTLNSAMTLQAPNGSVQIGVASFATSFTLSTATSGSGSVTGAGGYSEGSTATVNASAGSTWAFSHWTGDLSGFTDPDTILMDSDKSVTAVFVQNPSNFQVSDVHITGAGALPSEVTAGQVLSIDFDVDNNSSNGPDPANWNDDIFLSRDNVFGDDDKALSAMGVPSSAESYTATVSITIPDVSPGDYFLIMRVDTGDAITHTASDRAGGIATHALTIIDSELTQ